MFPTHAMWYFGVEVAGWLNVISKSHSKSQTAQLDTEVSPYPGSLALGSRFLAVRSTTRLPPPQIGVRSVIEREPFDISFRPAEARSSKERIRIPPP